MRASCAPVVQHRQATATLGKWPPGHFSPVARGSASDQNKGGAYAADTRPAPGVTARAAHAAPSCTVPSAELAPRITELGRPAFAGKLGSLAVDWCSWSLMQARYGTALQMDSLWSILIGTDGSGGKGRTRMRPKNSAPALSWARFPSHWCHGIVRHLKGCAVLHRSIRGWLDSTPSIVQPAVPWR